MVENSPIANPLPEQLNNLNLRLEMIESVYRGLKEPETRTYNRIVETDSTTGVLMSQPELMDFVNQLIVESYVVGYRESHNAHKKFNEVTKAYQKATTKLIGFLALTNLFFLAYIMASFFI